MHTTTRRPSTYRLIAFAAVLTIASSAFADQHTTGVPELSSNPGAAYTIYVNPAGFNYTGTWNPASGNLYTPGSTASVNDVANTGTFNAAEQVQIQKIWANIAKSFVGFNVNVTTIDPSIAAGFSATDVQRQAYYDATPNLMHTVIGSQVRPIGTPNTTPGHKWFSDGADGVSGGLGVVAGVAPVASGTHTNWMFSEDQAGASQGGVIRGQYIGNISGHENGHSFGLYHQGDYNGAGGIPVNEYTNGDTATGPGSYVATMGNADGRQRVAWRVGSTHPDDVQTIQNDVQAMLRINTAAQALSEGRLGGADMHIIGDGIGQSLLSATALPLSGNLVDITSPFSKGVIMPLSETNPQPINTPGVENYTADFFKFYTDGGDAVSLTATNATSFISPGMADDDGTLRSLLSIFDSAGNLVASGTEDASTLFTNYTGLLAAGDYVAKIASFGGHEEVSGYNPAQYFDMGAFFLTGSGFDVVPEPTSLAFLAIGGMTLMTRRRRA